MQIVYEIATGRKCIKQPIDAKELVATGEYSFDAPVENSKPPQIEVDAVATPDEAAPELDAPRRGRPRKH